MQDLPGLKPTCSSPSRASTTFLMCCGIMEQTIFSGTESRVMSLQLLQFLRSQISFFGHLIIKPVTDVKEVIREWDFPFIHRAVDSDSGCLEVS